jgi:hypothetical protein
VLLYTKETTLQRIVQKMSVYNHFNHTFYGEEAPLSGYYTWGDITPGLHPLEGGLHVRVAALEAETRALFISDEGINAQLNAAHLLAANAAADIVTLEARIAALEA